MTRVAVGAVVVKLGEDAPLRVVECDDSLGDLVYWRCEPLEGVAPGDAERWILEEWLEVTHRG